MSEDEAAALAAAVRRVHAQGVTVTGVDDAYVVEVVVASGRWTLYDEEDWKAWRRRMV